MMMEKKAIFFNGGIKLVNSGCKNQVFDINVSAVLEEFTDTLENAITYVKDEYGVYIK